jgi:hypothetical protein
MTIDQQLRESLKEVAREVPVSPAELAHAQHRIVHRREQLRARRRRAEGLVAAVTVVGLLLAGALGWRELSQEARPAAPVPEPRPQVVPLSVDTLAGVWLAEDGSGSLWFLHHDGTVSWSEPGMVGVDPAPDVRPVDYALTGSAIDLPDERCDWDLRITDDGRMIGRITGPPGPADRAGVADDGCTEGLWQTWVRLSPRSEAGAALGWNNPERSRQDPQSARWPPTPTAVGSVAGIARTWLQEGTGRLLAITPGDDHHEATFVLDDGGELLTDPDDVGTAVLDRDGALVLTSTTQSHGCPDGAVARFPEVVLRDVAGSYPPEVSPSLELVAVDGTCQLHQGLGGTWVQVSS